MTFYITFFQALRARKGPGEVKGVGSGGGGRVGCRREDFIPLHPLTPKKPPNKKIPNDNGGYLLRNQHFRPI